MSSPALKPFCFLILIAQFAHSQSYADHKLSMFLDDRHSYRNFKQILKSNCMPCHYRGITNGTDLSTSLYTFSESDLKNVLLDTLKNGDMPPNKVLREILYQKAIEIESSDK
jgi:hypothetical protein